MKSFSVRNYKNFEKFTLDNLANVNLIIGKNNVGKSALLEAISILAAGDFNQIRNILEFRGEGVEFSSRVENIAEKEMERFVSLYKDRNQGAFFSSPIEMESNLSGLESQDRMRVSIKLVKTIILIEIDDEGLKRPIRKVLNEDDECDESQVEYGIMLESGDKKSSYIFSGVKSFRRTINKIIPFEFVKTSEISSNRNPELFDQITLSPLEDELVRALQIIEPRIHDINFVKDESGRQDNRIAVVIYNENTQRYRLSSMGDGINRILTVILALLNCKDGILLIDEVENGLHYSVQIQLWTMIFELSQRLNVQVFATTHSSDCIKSFIKADKQSEGKLIRLEQRGSRIVSVEYYEKDEMDYISNENMEVR